MPCKVLAAVTHRGHLVGFEISEPVPLPLRDTHAIGRVLRPGAVPHERRVANILEAVALDDRGELEVDWRQQQL